MNTKTGGEGMELTKTDVLVDMAGREYSRMLELGFLGRDAATEADMIVGYEEDGDGKDANTCGTAR